MPTSTNCIVTRVRFEPGLSTSRLREDSSLSVPRVLVEVVLPTAWIL